MLDELRQSLYDVGLSQKEADVYLAMLELGPSGVQEISRKASVNRSTTYLILETLIHRGLASTFGKEKKVLFAAEHPDRLLSIVVDELSGVQTKKSRLESAMPKLLAIFNAIEDKPRVRFFEGAEALDAVRQEIVDAREPVWEVYAVDEAAHATGNLKGEERVKKTRRIQGRLLMAIKKGFQPLYFEADQVEVRRMEYDECPFSGSLTLVGKKLYVMNTKAIGMGIVIESEEITGIFRALYEAAWKCSVVWERPLEWRKNELLSKN
jgi:HTH-type transcriptional regulator, sugar sensing transcriptional regulator